MSQIKRTAEASKFERGGRQCAQRQVLRQGCEAASGRSVSRRRRGRGAVTNRTGRFESERREDFDDGWQSLVELEQAPLCTEVQTEPARSIISRNSSPDLPFTQSINPYRGCEHGCSYCYARPTHCYLGHSAGLDFETKLYAKNDVAALLERELSRAAYQPQVIALGANTDPYQPIERDYRLTRSLLKVLLRFRHPVVIVTKSAMVTRDIDLLSELAALDLIKVTLSITTLDRKLARAMEPRASTPAKRIGALAELRDAGVPTSVLVAPIIPALNDMEIESILEAAAEAGARDAGYVLLRLPLEIKQLFREWLSEAYSSKAKHVLNLLQSMHGGQDYDARFGHRQQGSGPYADMLAKRFQLALRRHGLVGRDLSLRCDLFERPKQRGDQMELF